MLLTVSIGVEETLEENYVSAVFLGGKGELTKIVRHLHSANTVCILQIISKQGCCTAKNRRNLFSEKFLKIILIRYLMEACGNFIQKESIIRVINNCLVFRIKK